MSDITSVTKIRRARGAAAPAGFEALALATRLAEDMSAAWARGERPRVEDYLAFHPRLHSDPEAVLVLAGEEARLSRRAGETADLTELGRRFPQCRINLAALLAGAEVAAPALPEVGDTFLECRLVAELGRGAQGRVFLATQPLLADRPVVLKASPCFGNEHLSLARLVLTHIVPLHFVHETAGLRVLCMPYLGGTTLAALHSTVHAVSPGQRTGRHLLEALDQARAAAPVDVPATGPVRALLARLDYAGALCWIGACLADALQHAHEHGLVHLDVKPSNVLLSSDCQPLLLDFHLARSPLAAGAGPPEWFGGSPDFMSPEQRRALEAQRRGEPVPEAVDGRSDLWSLGMVLYALLADGPPSSGRPSARALRRHNPQVSRGLADVLAKCLASDPRRRYSSAGAVAADLRAHLANRPLRGVGNRSLVERWRKWRRRRPGALARLALVCVALACVGALFAGGAWVLYGYYQEAERALKEGRDLLAAGRTEEAARVLQRGRERASGVPRATSLIEELDEARRHALAADALDQLHRTTEELRFLCDTPSWGPGQARALDEPCAQLWAARDRLLQEANGTDAERVRADLLDLAILGAELHVRATDGQAPARREALTRLDEAEALLGGGPVLDLARRLEREALGEPAGPASERPARTAWEHYALGRAWLRAGQLEKAAAALDTAVALQPQGLWPNFYQGSCAFARGKYAEAIAAFRVCVALAPQCAPCWYNRGLALDAVGQTTAARRDYDRALELGPGLAPAWLRRGLLNLREGRHEEALADLHAAIERGAEPAQTHYNLALAYRDTNAIASARRHLVEALRYRPDYRAARELLSHLR